MAYDNREKSLTKKEPTTYSPGQSSSTSSFVSPEPQGVKKPKKIKKAKANYHGARSASSSIQRAQRKG